MYALIVMYVTDHRPNIPEKSVVVTKDEKTCKIMLPEAMKLIEQSFHVEPEAIWGACRPVMIFDGKKITDTTGSEL